MNLLRTLGFALACLVALAVAGAGLVYANAQALSVTATKAELTTDTYTLGTPYAGTVQDIRIQRGDLVKAGEELFRIQSPTLQDAMQKESFSDAGVGYRIQKGGVMVFTAARSGVAEKVSAKIGSFVKADAVIARIAIANTLHLQGSFGLDARDYARVPRNGIVTVAMPDGSSVNARIYDVEVTGYRDAEAQTIVRARSPRIALKDYSLVGAPVTARLRLVDRSGPGTWLATALVKLFTPGGSGA